MVLGSSKLDTREALRTDVQVPTSVGPNYNVLRFYEQTVGIRGSSRRETSASVHRRQLERVQFHHRGGTSRSRTVQGHHKSHMSYQQGDLSTERLYTAGRHRYSITSTDALQSVLIIRSLRKPRHYTGRRIWSIFAGKGRELAMRLQDVYDRID